MELWARLIFYGLAGWCMEVAFTGVSRFLHERDVRLTGHSYLWMLPIYGLGGGLLELVHGVAAAQPLVLRAACAMLAIYGVEYSSGFTIRKLVGHSPWNYYGQTRWQLHGLVRFDYAPFWMGVGLGFEVTYDLLMRVRLS
jgi:uncharacterized membrane protein